MKYYWLRTESDPKVIGAKDGAAQVEFDKNSFTSAQMGDRFFHFFNADAFLKRSEFIPDLEYTIEHATLRNKAIITDVMSFGPNVIACPFIINKRVKTVFESHVLPEHYYFPVKVYSGNNLLDDAFYLLYCPFLQGVVDYENSDFVTGHPNLSNLKHIPTRSREDYVENLSKNPLMRCEKLALNNTFDKRLDFLMPGMGNIYISDRLRNSISNEKISGIKVSAERFAEAV